jgi:hypothetical protein
MYQYGGTIGASRYPRFYDSALSKISMLPRPVVNSRPGNIGHRLMHNCMWNKNIVKHVEYLTLQHLITDKSETSLMIRQHVRQSKNLIPSCLRICDTFFTKMIVVGGFDINSGDIPLHVDYEDHITALLSIGSPTVKGGGTLYYQNLNDDTFELKLEIPFRCGNVQIGSYDKVLHGSQSWFGGMRGVINFSLQKRILSHFCKYKLKYYQQYIDAGYPSGDFMAISKY